MSVVYSVIRKYQEILSGNMKFSFSGGRPTLGQIGVANRLFIFNLMQDKDVFLSFLQEAGLLKSEMKCERCDASMLLVPRKASSDGYTWICRNHVNGEICKSTKSIRLNSYFNCSRLKLEEIFMITYEIVKGTKTSDIEEEYFFSSNTLANWRQLIFERITEYIKSQPQKLGGDGKTVELCESKLGKRYNRGDAIDSRWVMGAVEKGSGKFFLITLPDGSSTTLISTIKEWIEPGTTVCSDDWKSYISLWNEGYIHLTYNHSLSFKDPHTGCNTLAKESTWTHVKNSVPSKNSGNEFQIYMAVYLFRKSCGELQDDTFEKFLEVIREVKWEEFHSRHKMLTLNENG